MCSPFSLREILSCMNRHIRISMGEYDKGVTYGGILVKITFDNGNTSLTTEKASEKTIDKTSSKVHAGKSGRTSLVNSVSFDRKGSVSDTQAYSGQGKNTEDIAKDASAQNLQAQSDYMIVMSSCTSTEDFAKMQRDGFHPGRDKIETVVTIVDQIKAEMAKSGQIIAGYNDDMDRDTLLEITGSEVYANAIKSSFRENDIPLTEDNVEKVMDTFHKISEVDKVGEGAAKYMVQNQMEPTVDNIYMAAYSVKDDGSTQAKGYYPNDMQGYYSKKAEVFNWSNLQPQMEKIIEQAGLPVSDETLSDSMWLIEKGLPLTTETLLNFEAIKEIQLPMKDGDIFHSITAAIADGKDTSEASLTDTRSALEKALQVWKDIQTISEAAVSHVAKRGEKINLQNLLTSQKQIDANAENYMAKQSKTANDNAWQGDNAKVTGDTHLITAKRQLEETRLRMTVYANYELIKSGYKIETAELAQLVEDLKVVENNAKEALFGTTVEAVNNYREKQYEDTMTVVSEIPFMPSATVALFIGQEENFTLKQVHETGAKLQSVYERAGNSYETMMTAPRADLGDSIKKAFRNVDELLADMEYDITEENRKAIRSLGYSRMALTDENIENVIDATRQLNNVIDKMTPAATLQMIRDNKNPLEMNIRQLETYLNSQEYTDETAVTEKYSEYLYKLEQNHAILEEERDAYIGVARLLRQIEKSDGGAVGKLVKSGAEINFKNLLTTIRSTATGFIDMTADENTGLSGEIVQHARSISAQISRVFEGKLENLPGAKEAAYEYAKDSLSDVQKISQVSDNVINRLLEYEQPVTVDNLLSANSLMNARGELFGKISRRVDGRKDTLSDIAPSVSTSISADADAFDEAVGALQDSFSDEASAIAGYARFSEKVGKMLEEQSITGESTAIDLKEIALLQKQVGMAVRFSREENYEVPVQINAGYTSINLKIVHNKEKGGKVTATMETAGFGKLAASFGVEKGVVSGYVAGEKDALSVQFEEIKNTMNTLLGYEGKKTGNINYIQTKDMDINRFEENDSLGMESEVDTKTLYTVAKAFIGAISR